MAVLQLLALVTNHNSKPKKCQNIFTENNIHLSLQEGTFLLESAHCPAIQMHVSEIHKDLMMLTSLNSTLNTGECNSRLRSGPLTPDSIRSKRD